MLKVKVNYGFFNSPDNSPSWVKNKTKRQQLRKRPRNLIDLFHHFFKYLPYETKYKLLIKMILFSIRSFNNEWKYLANFIKCLITLWILKLPWICLHKAWIKFRLGSLHSSSIEGKEIRNWIEFMLSDASSLNFDMVTWHHA